MFISQSNLVVKYTCCILAELSRKSRRSSTRNSDDLAMQQSVAKKCLHDYTDLKMDLLAQDISDLRFESDPYVIIRLLFCNFLSPIRKLLTPHLPEVKIAANNYYRLGLHLEAMAEGAIESTESVESLFNLMSVKRMWDNTRFFRKVVAAIPASAPERQAAEGILLHYNMHLDIFKQATLLRDALAKETKIDEKRTSSNEDDKLIPLKITSAKPIVGFTSEDCYRIQAQLLSRAYGIPPGKIICQDADERRSTTVTFVVPSQYMHDIIQCSMQLPTVWVLLELDIIEVSIPGVFTFIPSVGCFLSLLRGSKPFTADLLEVTEVRVVCNVQLLPVLLHPNCIDTCVHLNALITVYIVSSIISYTKDKFKMVICDLLMRALLNHHQTSQWPGLSTVECSRGTDVCK